MSERRPSLRTSARAASRAIVALTALCSVAHAQPPAGDEAAQVRPTPAPASAGSQDERLKRLERENAELRRRLDTLQEDGEFNKQQLEQLMPLSSRLSGYVDFGFFYVQGDGTGIRPDTGNVHFPEYANVVPDSWVFMGDPLSTAVNSRGEPADTGPSRAVVFDAIHNGGKPSFIVNSLNLGLFTGVGETVTVNASLDFIPRGRNVSDVDGLFLGDYLDVKLAYLEYSPKTEDFAVSISAGKFDSVLGREYRTQDALDRTGVTPSLICRYTCGRPLGIKGRARFFDERLIVNASVTNGTHFQEIFPFQDEIDVNAAKTVAGRVSYSFPLGTSFELGASGAWGAQDFQTDDGVRQWHAGVDAHLEWRDLEVTAEFVAGRAEGKGEADNLCSVAPCLRYRGGYGLVAYRLSNWLIPYVRGDYRNATHRNGASFVYLSDLARATVGARTEFGTHVVVKAEYTHNQELGRIPSFPNDVLTTSLVAKF
jgi:hypothetical protein